MTTTTREIHLAARPQGTPTPDDFRLVETTLPALADGQVLVRNAVMSVDPYMRGRMNDVKSYVPPFEVGAPLDGGAVGEVVESSSPDVPVGAMVQHMQGWREHAVLPAREVRVLDTDAAPASAYLGALGMPGLTAYVGLTRIARLVEGDSVFVSGAAGAVGSMVGQLARRLGAAKVVGSAGSAAKVAWLTDDLRFDAAFDYREGPVLKQLAPHAPVDVYFDNVGGTHLEAALFHMADFGRIAMCGAIADYDATTPPPGPRFLTMAVTKRLKIEGFIVTDHGDAAGEFYQTVGPWLASGEITYRETYADGIEQAVEAFLGLATGANIGKMLVRL